MEEQGNSQLTSSPPAHSIAPTWEDVRVNARNTLGRTATALWGSGDDPGVIGSGFVIADRLHDVLITAGHVLEGCLPLIGPEGTTATGWLFRTPTDAIPIGGGISRTRPGLKTFDIGIVKLHDRIGDGAEWHPVPRSAIEVTLGLPLTGLYVALGFPLSRSHWRPSLKRTDTILMPIFAVPADATKYLELGFDPDDNLLLAYESHNEAGQKKFKPKGMSGGPVWGCRWSEIGIEWSLEGMLIEHYEKQKLLRCMRIGEILRQVDLTPDAKKRPGDWS